MNEICSPAGIAPRAVKLFLLVLGVTVMAGVAQSGVLRAGGLPPGWLGVGYGGLEHFHQYVWAYSLLNVTGAMLIFCALEDTPVCWFLRQPGLAYVGMISFGLYVLYLPRMHIPLQLWPASCHSMSGLIRFMVYFLVTVGLVSASFFNFENRFPRLQGAGPGAAPAQTTMRPPPAVSGHAN